MTQPFNVAAMSMGMHQPGDPVQTVPKPCHEVRLRALRSERDQIARWDEPQRWCRANVDHAAGHLWSRRMDRGFHHERDPQPVYAFSDAATASAFALKYP